MRKSGSYTSPQRNLLPERDTLETNLKIRFLVTLAVIALSCSFTGTAQTAATSPKSNDKVHAGQELFTQKCFQCHSVQERQVKLGPSLYRETKAPNAKKTPAEVRETITNGKGKMPSFKEKLTKQEIDELVAYIHSL